jgi:hypothetical protein
MDRLTAMQVFTEVAGTGSFSAAADKLDMSPAMWASWSTGWARAFCSAPPGA